MYPAYLWSISSWPQWRSAHVWPNKWCGLEDRFFAQAWDAWVDQYCHSLEVTCRTGWERRCDPCRNESIAAPLPRADKRRVYTARPRLCVQFCLLPPRRRRCGEFVLAACSARRPVRGPFDEGASAAIVRRGSRAGERIHCLAFQSRAASVFRQLNVAVELSPAMPTDRVPC